ncbi:hypothetical protein JCM10450v2_008081 [Rhodotorula kratochvilovae]
MVGTRSQRIPLSSLTALTLHKNKRTAARRTSPIPQLACRGSACRSYQPDVVQCVAVGSDGAGGLEWKCEADLPRGVRFGEVQVGCEGWDGPDDTYILRGSCGLEYSLVRSSSALEDGGSFAHTLPASLKSYLPRSAGSLFDSGFNLVFAALTAYLALSLLRKLLRRFFPRLPSLFGGGTGGPGGGPGGGGSSRPPPPPPPGGPPPPYTPKPAQPANDGGASWRPGFWTGAAAGWAANAVLGATRPRERERMQPVDYAAVYGDGTGRGYWGGGGGAGLGGAQAQRRGWGGWGGAGAGAGGRRFDDADDRGVGGSGSGGGGMRRSAGFGGTSVR